jgi:hypothetical protein
VTVCIAVAVPDHKTILTVSDTLYSAADYAAEGSIVKWSPIAAGSGGWCAMYAGTDSYYGRISDGVIVKLAIGGEGLGIETVRDAYRAVFHGLIRQKIDEELLAPLGWDLPYFLNNGLAKLGAELFAQYVSAVDAMNLDTWALVGGHDPLGKAHLFSVSPKGEISDHSALGFHAIGDTAWAALGLLYSRPGFMWSRELDAIAYTLCEAKFAADMASPSTVGKKTLIYARDSAGKHCLIRDDQLFGVRRAWDAAKKRPAPVKALRSLRKALQFQD